MDRKARSAREGRTALPIDTWVAVLLMPAVVVWAIPAGALVEALGLGRTASGALVELVCFAAPALATAALTTGAPLAALGLVRSRPRARPLAGALLLGGSFWYLNAVVIAPLLAGRESESDTMLRAALDAPEPLSLKLIAIALLPAVCEELLVRGAIARGLARRFGLAGAVVVSSAYFSVLHLSPARALPTAALGAVLAIATLRTGSLVPAMVVHALNNGIAVVIDGLAPDAPAARLLERPGLVLPVAIACSSAGLALLWSGAKELRPPSEQGPIPP